MLSRQCLLLPFLFCPLPQSPPSWGWVPAGTSRLHWKFQTPGYINTSFWTSFPRGLSLILLSERLPNSCSGETGAYSALLPLHQVLMAPSQKLLLNPTTSAPPMLPQHFLLSLLASNIKLFLVYLHMSEAAKSQSYQLTEEIEMQNRKGASCSKVGKAVLLCLADSLFTYHCSSYLLLNVTLSPLGHRDPQRWGQALAGAQPHLEVAPWLSMGGRHAGFNPQSLPSFAPSNSLKTQI